MSFWLKFTVTVNFLLLMLKCLKFNCFMLQSQKIKCLVLSRCPHSDPHTTKDERKCTSDVAKPGVILFKGKI